MSKEALLNALRHQAATELKDLRRDTGTHYARLRKEYAVRLRQARSDQRGQFREALHEKLQSEITRCRHEQNERLTAHRAQLEVQLRLLAEEALQNLWHQKRGELFPQLLNELPRLNWSRFLVAPDDLNSLTLLVDSAPMESEARIRGGLIAECEERDMIADATLCALLKRLWPVLLPELLKRITDECRKIKT